MESSDLNFKAILAQSKTYFETVMRLYYLRHGYELPDGQLPHTCVILAYEGLLQQSASSNATSTSSGASALNGEARSTLILASKGLADQGKNYFLPRALYEIIENEMSAEDKDVLHQHVHIPKDEEESLLLRSTYICSQYPVGMDWANIRRRKGRLDEVTREFTATASEAARQAGSRTHP